MLFGNWRTGARARWAWPRKIDRDTHTLQCVHWQPGNRWPLEHGAATTYVMMILCFLPALSIHNSNSNIRNSNIRNNNIGNNNVRNNNVRTTLLFEVTFEATRIIRRRESHSKELHYPGNTHTHNGTSTVAQLKFDWVLRASWLCCLLAWLLLKTDTNKVLHHYR